MQYGIHLFPTENSIQPDELAIASEERGFESVWFSEHTHIPVHFLTTSERGSTLPDYYWQTYDLFIASTLAAAATKTIRIGTGVCLVVEHETITLAKAVATIDQVSSGRFIFGVGAGWLAEEMENHGVAYQRRYRVIDEQMSAMKNIWTEEQASFRGKYVNFSKMKSYPKPYQSPYPPIIAGGGAGPKSLEFILKHCQGWMPILRGLAWVDIKDGIAALRHQAEEVGRDPGSIELSLFCWGLPDGEMREEMEAHGIEKLVISLEAKNRQEVLPLLDEYARLV